jgi:hypothetical protein
MFAIQKLLLQNYFIIVPAIQYGCIHDRSRPCWCHAIPGIIYTFMELNAKKKIFNSNFFLGAGISGNLNHEACLAGRAPNKQNFRSPIIPAPQMANRLSL